MGTVALGGCIGNATDATTSVKINSTSTRITIEDKNTTNNREHDETTIGFAGDTMVGRSLNHIYGEEDVEPTTIWGDFHPHLESLDGVFCNLECSLSKRGDRFPNRRYYFRGDPNWAVPALTAGNICFASLANNHAMDFGAVALIDTIDVLEAEGIETTGAGKTAAVAHAPARFSVGDVDVAVVSFSDEYKEYAATDDRPGIAWAPTDRENPETRRVIGNAVERAQSKNPDLLVASVHWGENWIEYPSDRLVAFGHWLVDQGVDLVHGHSAHVVQAIELYGDGVILHDTGNLVDDFGVKDDLGNDNSYLFEVTLHDGDFEKIRLVPFHIDNGVSRATKNEAAWLRKTIRERSEPFETSYERDGVGLVVQL
jgi:poly-gamma-glutamate capsule biosynthesis protein CapA/YwtB (metallophosphatase superfamily)